MSAANIREKENLSKGNPDFLCMFLEKALHVLPETSACLAEGVLAVRIAAVGLFPGYSGAYGSPARVRFPVNEVCFAVNRVALL